MFIRALDTSSERLVGFDVFDAVLILVVLDGNIDSGQGDGLSGEPADALETENLIAVVAESLVLYPFIRRSIRGDGAGTHHRELPADVAGGQLGGSSHSEDVVCDQGAKEVKSYGVI